MSQTSLEEDSSHLMP